MTHLTTDRTHQRIRDMATRWLAQASHSVMAERKRLKLLAGTGGKEEHGGINMSKLC
jgi:hypothetical protein